MTLAAIDRSRTGNWPPSTRHSATTMTPAPSCSPNSAAAEPPSAPWDGHGSTCSTRQSATDTARGGQDSGLIALTLLGAAAFHTTHPKPVKPGGGARFSPLVYSLDLLIPIGGLGQRNAWYWEPTALQWTAYAMIAAGWLLTTAVIAGVSRVLNRT
ncbi:hypothetical protein ACFTZK_08125 [Streptomyces decoyicus]|uniref:hypothetical protein n=1 Tax=Streptomyces decoyicus TaxID=249567 RepID=UPI00362954EB